MKSKTWLRKIQHFFPTLVVLALALLIAGMAHGYNMFHFPYFENDEGTYVSQGYAVAYQGKLADYTYWYDHIPGGWVLIAAWLRLTNGPFTFGFSLFSGRIFMLVIHLLSSVLLFIITKKITHKNWPAFLAVVIFSITPLGVYFQRRVLLDNIMTFWVMASMAFLLLSKYRLRWIALSGICMALAVLSKETAIVAVPALLVLVLQQLKARQRIVGGLLFLLPVGLGLGYFFLYALLKNEFFPGSNHVSLVSTWVYQLSRGGKLPFWNHNSDFYSSFSDWWGKDPWFVLASIVSLVWFALSSFKNKSRLGVALTAIAFWFFMIRGSLVINFYVVPLIAFGALTISIMLFDLSRIKLVGFLLTISIFFSWSFFLGDKMWTTDETTPQIKSVDWIKNNLPPQSIMAVDHFELLDLQLARTKNEPVFNNANWFWKLEDDPQISQGLIHGDWQNIEYLVLTHEFIKQMGDKALPLLSPVLEHSREIASWGPLSKSTYLNVPKLISTNGDWVKIFHVLDRVSIVLFDSWQTYRKVFISYDGQVLDPKTNMTTSEGQAYAMLRAFAAGDRDHFDLSWTWTKNHLQFRQNDKLFSWEWQGDGKTGKQLDSNWAADADIDIATALILASKAWNNPVYLTEAKEIVQDIWWQEIVQLNTGRYVVLAGPWAVEGNIVTLNPSYLSPAAFHLFAEIDPKHPWNKVADDSYVLLNKACQLNAGNLPPDWVEIDSQTEAMSGATKPGQTSNFGYDAIRVFFRVAEDATWFKEPTAISFLQQHQFLTDYWNEHKMIPAGFLRSGKPAVTFGNNAFYGALLPYVKIVDSSQYNAVKSTMMTGYQDGQWAEANNYYTQNWAWLGLALAEGKLVYER